jgi:hypothetical protein
MNTYEVCNKISSHSFGFFQAGSEKEALKQLAHQAGYNSYEEACVAVESTDELVVSLVETDVIIGDVDPADFQEFCDAHKN